METFEPDQEPEIFYLVKSHIDESLSTQYAELKKAGVKLSAFWSLHKDVCSLVISAEDMETLLQANGSWTRYEDALTRMMQSKTGKAQWEWAMAKLVDHKVDAAMQRFSQIMSELPNFTYEACHQAQATARQSIAEIPDLKLLSSKRDVTIPYRGRRTHHSINSTEDELQRRTSAEAKGRGVQSGKIVAMTFEDDLVDGYKMNHQAVDDALLVGVKEARQAACKYIELESAKPDGALAVKVLGIKEKTLTAMDRCFCVEIAFFRGMAGSEGQSLLMSKVGRTLPSADDLKTPEQSLSEMSPIFASSLFEFSSKTSQESAGVIRQAVTSISLKRRPRPLEPTAGSDVKQLFQRLGYFCQLNVLDGNDTTKVVSGKPAIDLIYDGVAKKVEAGESLDMADLHFGRFHWLLSPEQATELKKWTRSLMPSWDGDMPGDIGGDDKEDKATQHKRKRAKIAESEVDAAVDDTFA